MTSSKFDNSTPLYIFEKHLTLTLLRFQSGCARFVGGFVFNRKRNVVELEIKQDAATSGTLKYVVSLNK